MTSVMGTKYNENLVAWSRASDEQMNTPALQREHPTKNMTIDEKLDWLIAEAKKTKSHDVQDAGHGLPGNQWPRNTDHDMS